MIKLLLLFFSCLIYLNSASADDSFRYSPSVNCQSKDLSNIETFICKNADLAIKDGRLHQLYLLALKKSIDSNFMKSSQENWLKLVRNPCTTEDCLMRVYENREIYLGNIAIRDGKFNITAEEFSKERSHWKSNDNAALLAKMRDGFLSRPDLNAKVISCESTWENHTGTVNHAYGGICQVKINRKLNEYYICSNAVSDHFSPATVRNEYLLVRFIESNCYGG